MFNLMIEEMKRWNADPSSRPRALIMSGMGGKAFCAGGDIVKLNDCQAGLYSKTYLVSYF